MIYAELQGVHFIGQRRMKIMALLDKITQNHKIVSKSAENSNKVLHCRKYIEQNKIL
jgi:hypothetical protein